MEFEKVVYSRHYFRHLSLEKGMHLNITLSQRRCKWNGSENDFMQISKSKTEFKSDVKTYDPFCSWLHFFFYLNLQLIKLNSINRVWGRIYSKKKLYMEV